MRADITCCTALMVLTSHHESQAKRVRHRRDSFITLPSNERRRRVVQDVTILFCPWIGRVFFLVVDTTNCVGSNLLRYYTHVFHWSCRRRTDKDEEILTGNAIKARCKGYGSTAILADFVRLAMRGSFVSEIVWFLKLKRHCVVLFWVSCRSCRGRVGRHASSEAHQEQYHTSQGVPGLGLRNATVHIDLKFRSVPLHYVTALSSPSPLPPPSISLSPSIHVISSQFSPFIFHSLSPSLVPLSNLSGDTLISALLFALICSALMSAFLLSLFSPLYLFLSVRFPIPLRSLCCLSNRFPLATCHARAWALFLAKGPCPFHHKSFSGWTPRPTTARGVLHDMSGCSSSKLYRNL